MRRKINEALGVPVNRIPSAIKLYDDIYGFLSRLKDYVEKNDYKKHIYYDKPISDKMGKRMIKVLGQDKIYDKKYLYDYIYSLHDFGIEKKLFDKDFIDFLVMFRKFVIK